MPTGYTTLAALVGSVPERLRLEALDDDNDGVEDAGVFDLVLTDAEEQIDGLLSARFEVPFATPFPALVKLAAKVIVAELLYKRRGVEDKENPWKGMADTIRKQLQAIGENKAPAPGDFPTVAKPAAVIISEAARTHSEAGRLSV